MRPDSVWLGTASLAGRGGTPCGGGGQAPRHFKVAPDWLDARAAAVAALDELARVEARPKEYRFEVGPVVRYAMPDVDENGQLDSEDLAGALPLVLDC
ncbi:hypothetical protein [Pseudonocardia sp. McavD-2-B]|uniref:hypothetical protein n=1 Tax=Pseudonocardia sp. McavD-2-B TaxID=2954499 RepID=UPI0020979BBF|nr:hypothetical protein [Pseudonocardia sp. McavD-2-B]MCO7192020.1 hypothetical protein [Pseudonocardia sp. McavD-2-B]